MIKLIFFVPIEDKEKVKKAVFNAGAGKIGNYDCCCFETIGTGQFRPLGEANPTVGEVGKIEIIKEVKIEMVLDDKIKEKVEQSLVEAHPYETPAYEFYSLLN